MNKEKFNGHRENFLSMVDCHIEIAKEKIPGKGEDSYVFAMENNEAIIGVFDGCGGAGARTYDVFGGRTGAYIASRVISGAVLEWFRASDNSTNTIGLKDEIKERLNICNNVGGRNSLIKGKISKDFPSTLAVTICRVNGGQVTAQNIWAGDSRCFILSKNGLVQLTEDDVDVSDAMENLTADGTLTNLISCSDDFVLHSKTIEITSPCIVFAATDGCFGYFSTPMEFEYMLLECLVRSNSITQWEENVHAELDKIAGDDFTLCGLSIGYKEFKNIKKSLSTRAKTMHQRYIKDIHKKSHEEKVALWNQYKVGYSAYLNQSK